MKKVYNDADLPLVEIIINDDDQTGMRLLSLVEKPAIEIKANMFSETAIKDFAFKADNSKQILAGPIMIPNMKILRKDTDGSKYNVFFSQQTIEQIMDKFTKDNNNKSVNVDHSTQMAPAFIAQHWIVKDPQFDTSRTWGFKDLPIGTCFTVVKVDQTPAGKKFWQDEVVGKGQYGFSIEGLLGEIPAMSALNDLSFSEHIMSLTEEELLNYLVENIK